MTTYYNILISLIVLDLCKVEKGEENGTFPHFRGNTSLPPLKSLEQCHVKHFPLLSVNCSSCSLLQRIKRGESYSPSAESKSMQPCHVKRFFVAQAKSTKGKKTKMPQVAFKDLILKKQKIAIYFLTSCM